jgi:hypothetical protein
LGKHKFGKKDNFQNIFLFLVSRIKHGQPNRMTSSKDQGRLGSLAAGSGGGDADEVDGEDLKQGRRTPPQEEG